MSYRYWELPPVLLDCLGYPHLSKVKENPLHLPKLILAARLDTWSTFRSHYHTHLADPIEFSFASLQLRCISPVSLVQVICLSTFKYLPASARLPRLCLKLLVLLAFSCVFSYFVEFWFNLQFSSDSDFIYLFGTVYTFSWFNLMSTLSTFKCSLIDENYLNFIL